MPPIAPATDDFSYQKTQYLGIAASMICSMSVLANTPRRTGTPGRVLNNPGRILDRRAPEYGHMDFTRFNVDGK